MIRFKAIVIPGNRRKDGTYLVYIRITFKGQVRRLATTITCTPAELTRGLKIKSADILNRTDALIGKMRDAVRDFSPFDLDDHDVDWVVSAIRDKFSKDDFHLDFFEWCEKYMVCKSPVTRRNYSAALNAFGRFLGRRSIDINDISRGMLVEFAEFVEAEPWMHFNQGTKMVEPASRERKSPQGASTRHLAKLEHMFNAAKERYNDEDGGRILIPRSPFAKIPKVYPISKGQDNLGVDLIQQIISAETDDPGIRTALDLFIVSFGLMGVNIADLYMARPFKGDTWIYNRQKTRERRQDGALMRVEIPDELRPYLDRLRGSGRWWLNELHNYANTKNGASARVNRNLRKWCEANKVDVFTFGAARHSWASICRNDCKVDKSTVDDCLCHIGSFKVTDIYAEKAWDLMTEANQKVLNLFDW
jgi:integrase